MNHYFPDWNLDPEHPKATHGKALRSSQELVELLWENGHVVLNNQTHRKPIIDPIESRQGGKFNQSSNHVEGFSLINPPILAQDDDHPASWNHCQIDDPFEKELSSFLLAELPPISNLDLAHENRSIQQLDSFKFCNNDGSQISHVLPYNGHSETLCGNPSQSQPTKFKPLNPVIPHPKLAEVVSNSKHAPNNPSHHGGGSSHCGSNQVIHDADTSLASCSEVGRRMTKTAAEEEDNYGKVASESERSNDRETAVSLSGGSGFTSIGGTWNQSIETHSSKRKSRDADNSEPQSEAALLESETRKKASQKSGTTRKSRAAEVHNLSERRRRDRVNEKMRALQELLPRSNQPDKASMLDDAIKYIKSLQLQLQMMWMGSQMAPMMFPGCQVPPYMSRSELGISPQMLPFIQSAMNLSRLPLMDQAMAVASTPNQAAICQATLLNSMNYQNQLQNSNFSDQYGNCMGFYPFQNANQQPMNMYSYGSNIPHQNQAPPSDANGPRPL